MDENERKAREFLEKAQKKIKGRIFIFYILRAGKSSMDNKLLRYGAKEHLTKAVICNFLIDTINGQKALQTYEEAYPLFADSRECTLLKKISEALNHESVEGFTAAVAEYDSITRLEPWTTEMLLKLKKTIADEEDIT
uniref:Alpha-soluble NSF attachment protein n=1 Tax=Schistocephalus solidus TaxID=70667 RepID=A0A0X3PWD1_SCHSO